MNKILITTAAIALLSSCEKGKVINSINKEVEHASVLEDKEWKIKSILTFPALIDVNGDGKKDNEIISSLQKREHDKTIVFSKSGEVFENHITDNELPSQKTITANGTWLKNIGGDTLIWKQSDGRLFAAKVNYVSANEIELLYAQDGCEIKFGLRQN